MKGLNLNNSTVVFLHIPKTAGTLFQQIIKQNISSNIIEVGAAPNKINYNRFKKLCRKGKIECQALTGHLQYGIGQYLVNKPYYITFLREPVSRYISQYNDIKRKGFATVQHLLRRNDISIKQFKDVRKGSFSDFLKTPLSQFYDNLQVRYLCDMNIYKSVGIKELNEAKLNLKENIDWFGITEEFSKSIKLLHNETEWAILETKKINVTPTAIKYIPNEREKEYVKERNNLDIELYNYAKRLLEKRCSAYNF